MIVTAQPSQARPPKPKPRLGDPIIDGKIKINKNPQTFNQVLVNLGKQNSAYKLN